jgi:succinate dehydrogenase/fumarate reductase flavoprotein subunit
VQKDPTSLQFDVIVLGSGAAGLTAAVVAAKQGLKVLVLEKTRYFGGTTAYSGGAPWVPANKYQPNDTKDAAAKYLRNVLGSARFASAEANINAYLDAAPKMIEWMETNTAVKYQPTGLPDYRPNLEGASKGRTIVPIAFNGRLLGQELRRVRYTLQGMTAFGSMQVSPFETDILQDPFGSVSNFVHTVKKGANWVLDLLLYGKGSFMVGGNALVGGLLYTAIESGVTLETEAHVAELLMEGHRVVGVVFSGKTGERMRIIASKGVVLATGGFGRSEEGKRYVAQEWSAVPKTNLGDGINLGRKAGGYLPAPNEDNAIYAPMSVLRSKEERTRQLPHFAGDRAEPGSIIVDEDGNRFENESKNYQDFVRTMNALNISKAYYIADADHLQKYGMGMALPWPYWNWDVLRKGYLVQAATIAELAEKLDIPTEALQHTVETMNTFARTGKDVQFHRGENIYDQFYGDPAVKPNPSLGLVARAPFYALPLYPGNVSVMYGLSTNQDAQVLQKDGAVVEGLYAAGCDNNSIMRGAYPGGGSSIGPAMTFGYIAALHMAGQRELALA